MRSNSVLTRHLHSFSSCCLPKMRNSAKIPRKFDVISVQSHPRSSTLVPIESAYATSYWSLLVTLVVSFSRYWSIKLENTVACFSTPPLF